MPYVDRQTRALAEQRRERLEREAHEQREADDRKESNEKARARYLETLESERAVRRAAADARLEDAIAPEKVRLMRDWLANHPGKGEKDFMAVAWKYLRLNVIAERDRRQSEDIKAAMRSTGKYSF